MAGGDLEILPHLANFFFFYIPLVSFLVGKIRRNQENVKSANTNAIANTLTHQIAPS